MKQFFGATLLVCCLLAGSAIASQPEAARFDNYKVYKVSVKDEAQLAEFKKLGNNLPVTYLQDVGGADREYDIAVDPANQQRLEQLLQYLELAWNVQINDLQDILEQALYNSTSPMDWDSYHSLDVIYDWIDRQCLRNFLFVKCEVIGFSYEGRPIKSLTISKRQGNKAIFIEGNIHAVEWISSATVTYLLNELLNSDDPSILQLTWNYDWIFVPVLNPDGFVYTHDVSRLWRKNRRPTGFSNSSGICYGIDMNRNFGFHWGGAGWNIDVPCDHWYGGAEPNSEPEVQALESFVSALPDGYVGAYIAMHSYGQYLLLPYGHTTTEFPENYDQMLRIAKAFADAAVVPYGTNFTYGASGILSYVVSGAVKDWAYGVKGIPFTCTLELRDRGQYGFFLPAAQIKEVGVEVTLGLRALIAKGTEEGIFG
ncbi:zinc carboxypeptidase-like [Scaptodrosophila lebanonensis]|uniref:Zinc carboxypeptidase-like n=1 Tax=Drosophila lebanonensis TaxID=7225 RepID=A0A6J2UMH2_DROLE|nr:zinc carboxypeptidase-like [Scaptodrosophila lebanonensis]